MGQDHLVTMLDREKQLLDKQTRRQLFEERLAAAGDHAPGVPVRLWMTIPADHQVGFINYLYEQAGVDWANIVSPTQIEMTWFRMTRPQMEAASREAYRVYRAASESDERGGNA